ncbi:hypothetical protein RIR_jg35311.t2 [Rhizophagus irregularis DAOM 181602=DAOM 197198]|nr:hypothetical protein RIR_jg35311.t2 [Rhizophagus irregularis DAOM 181602=DAOM 197198]
MGRSCYSRRLPQDLEAHFSNECSEIPANTRQFFLNCLAAKAEGNITINLEQITAKKRKLNNNTGIQTKISDFHESITFTELKIHEIDRACVKAFALVMDGELESHQGGSALKEEAKACDISGGGLKKWEIYNLKNPEFFQQQYYQCYDHHAFFDDIILIPIVAISKNFNEQL